MPLQYSAFETSFDWIVRSAFHTTMRTIRHPSRFSSGRSMMGPVLRQAPVHEGFSRDWNFFCCVRSCASPPWDLSSFCPGQRLRQAALFCALCAGWPTRSDAQRGREAKLRADWSTGVPGPRIEELAWLNPEYDLLSRTFLVLALADRALANPEEADAQLALMDVIIDDTLDTEASHPHGHWLLSYWDPKEVRGTGRSLFVDGELLTLINARRLVRDDRPELRSAAKRQSARVRANFGSGSPLGTGHLS